jgi:hypothetical protein
MNASDSREDNASVLLTSGEGIILDASEATCLALGWSREELVGKGLGELLEYGGDLLMAQLNELQAGSIPEGWFSVSALVRRQDQTHFPVTAVVRPILEMGCFAVGFEDLPGDVAEATEFLSANGMAAATSPLPNETGNLDLAEPAEVPETDSACALRSAEEKIPEELPREVEETNAKANGDVPRFRNTLFLSGSKRVETESNGSPRSSGDEEIAPQLENERQERRRLEARVLSLNDQLQQLHLQLKSNLETENIYHKRVSECEEAVRKAEQGKTAAEETLREQWKRQEILEHDFAEFKSAYAQAEDERKSWEQQWLSKLQSSLAALQESDARMEKEIATRRGLDVTLQMLRQDFCAQSKNQEPQAQELRPRSRVASELAEPAPPR